MREWFLKKAYMLKRIWTMTLALLRAVQHLGQRPDPIRREAERWGRLFNSVMIISSSLCSLYISVSLTPTCLYLTCTHFLLISAKWPSLIGPLCLQDLPETPVAGVRLSGWKERHMLVSLGLWLFVKGVSLMSVCTTRPRREKTFFKARERQEEEQRIMGRGIWMQKMHFVGRMFAVGFRW